MGSSMFSQIIPGLGIAGMPLVGGPVIAPVPKAQQNVTTFPGVQAPHVPYVDPAALMNALANTQNVQSEAELRKQQSELFKAQVARLMQQVNTKPGDLLPTPPPTGGAPDVATAPMISPSAASDGSEGAGSPNIGDSLGPNQQKIADTLASLGHSPAQIAGALGWGATESGGSDTNTSALNNTGKDGQLGGSYGWQQWLADRRDNLNQFAKDAGTSPNDPVTQAKFFDHEMRTGEGAGQLASDAYWNAQTPADAVVAMAHYGRGQGYTPADPQNTIGFGQRLVNAQKIYPMLAGAAGNAAPGPQYAQVDTGTMSDASGAGVQPLSETPQATPIPGRALSPLEQFRQQALARVNGTAPLPGTSAPQQQPSQPARATPAPTPPPPLPKATATALANTPPGAAPPPVPVNQALEAWHRSELAKAELYDARGFPPGVGNTIRLAAESEPSWQAYSKARQADVEARTKLGFAGPTAAATAGATKAAELPFAGPIAGATTTAQEAAKFPYAGPTAAAQAAARMPFTATRPGGAFPVPGANGLPSGQFITAPVLGEQTNSDLSQSPVYRQMTPQGPVTTPVPGTQITKAPPREVALAEASGKAQGEEEQKTRQANIDAGSAGQGQQAALRILQNDAPRFYTGPFAEHINDARALIRLLPGGDSVADSVASRESFDKNAGQLVRQAVRETSSRAAVQEFKLIGNTLPSEDMSPMGLQRVLGEYMGLNDYKIAKAQAQAGWENAHGGPGRVTGFETDWQANVSPYAFIFARMSPADKQRWVDQVGSTQEGRAELQHLQQQIQYIQSSGLAKYLQ